MLDGSELLNRNRRRPKVDPMSLWRFSTSYTLYGRHLDLDELFSRARPRCAYEEWRKGEPGPLGPSNTSGLRIEVMKGRSDAVLFRSVLRFLEREERFLKAAARFSGPKIWSVLTTALYVRETGPVTLSLPKSLLTLASRSGVGWSITGYPCSD